jgi:uncharacterized protein (DUF1501 family)
MTNRRQFLTGAVITAAALATPSLLRTAQASRPVRKLIMVIAGGGWDTSYAFDPKPGLATVDAPAGDVALFGNTPIFSSPDRPGIDAFFGAYGAMTAVINGIDVRSIVHPNCMRRMITGGPDESMPDLGAISAWELGRDLPAPYLVLGTNGLPGSHAAISAQVGFTKQIKALLDPKDAYAVPAFQPDAADEQLISDYLQGRVDRAVEGRIGAYNENQLHLLLGARASGEAFKSYSEQLGPRGITLSTRDQMVIAADALANGVSFSAAVTDSPMPTGWDTHGDNTPQGQYQSDLMQAVLELADDLAIRPGSTAGSKLLDETVVMVLSEMGRTPRLNESGGKDHWPITSALVFGAGVKGGRAYGATTDDVAGETIDLSTGEISASGDKLLADNVVAGVLELVGVDPAAYLPEVEVFDAFIA